MSRQACAGRALGGGGAGETRSAGRAAARGEQRAPDCRRVLYVEEPKIKEKRLGADEFRSAACAAWLGH